MRNILNVINAKTVAVAGLLAAVGACSSDGTSSTGGGMGQDASSCVERTLRTVYSNDCDFDVYAIILDVGEEPFRINANRAVTRSETGNSFGACRAPSMPVLSADASTFTCS